jgi:type IV pilus assembly protein PilB
MAKKRLGELLTERQQISPYALEAAIEEQKKKLVMLGELLLQSGSVSKDDLTAALEELTGIPYVNADTTPVDPELLAQLPKHLARHHCALPLAREIKKAVVVMAEPQNLRAVDELRFVLGCEISPRLGLRSEITAALARYYSDPKSPGSEIAGIAEKLGTADIEFFSSGANQRHDEAIREFQREMRNQVTPAVQLVSAMLGAAAAKNASDIHMEQQAPGTLVRIRVDGVLRDLTFVPSDQRNSLVSRIKILCDMDIAERRVPQDGRLLARIGQTQYDLRVSTMPTQYGEKVTIRLLDPTAARVSFQDLGLSEDQCAALQRTLALPQGMLLVTGPTGSGKSTTLYAALNQLRSPGVSIVTIEDPVEYVMEGINQVQVNPRAGRTFAGCLRSMLRQDPNIIMVGEVRDAETAEIALQTAQTGHLVLSTLHTNDAVGAITRLLDLEMPGFLIASSVTSIVAQRLVRKLCACRQESAMTAERAAELAAAGMLEVPAAFFVPVGCEACDGAGYRGRVGVFEMLVLDEEMRSAICSGARDDQLRARARTKGMKGMQEDALEKVCLGMTTLEEVMRLVPFDKLTTDHCARCARNLVSSFAFCPHCAAPVGREKQPVQVESGRVEVGAGGVVV